MPLDMAYGCNKMQSLLGTSASLFKYTKSKLIDPKPALIACITAIIGSMVSTRIMLSLDEGVKKGIVAGAMCFIIILTLFTTFCKLSKREKT